MKNGTDKKGPQIARNQCEGPQGRTTLKNVDIQKVIGDVTQEVRHDRNFEAAKKEWLEQKEKERQEAEKKKQAAQ